MSWQCSDAVKAWQTALSCLALTAGGVVDFGTSSGAYDILLQEGAVPRRVLYTDLATISIAEVQFGALRLKAQIVVPVSDEDRARLPEYWEQDRIKMIRQAEESIEKARSLP